MKKILLCMFTATIIFGGCKKDDDESKTAIEYLTAHKWRYVGATINPATDWFRTGDEITDIFAELDECDKDDLIEFNADGKYYTLAGETKCDESDSDRREEGSYSVSEDGKTLTREGLIVSASIEEISDSKLKLVTTSEGESVTVTFTEIFEAE